MDFLFDALYSKHNSSNLSLSRSMPSFSPPTLLVSHTSRSCNQSKRHRVHIKSLDVNFFHYIIINNRIKFVFIPLYISEKGKPSRQAEWQLKGPQEVEARKENLQVMLLQKNRHDTERIEVLTKTTKNGFVRLKIFEFSGTCLEMFTPKVNQLISSNNISLID